MSDYALRLVRDFANAVRPALNDDEHPRLVERDGVVEPADPRLTARPGSVRVFINPAHRMVVLRGDEYRSDLCRKINESRYGPPYFHAPVIGSENSEDATTWTFLRTLERRCRPEWIIRALQLASGVALRGTVDRIVIRYWFGRVTDEKLPIPPGVNERATELDALVEFYLNGELHLVSVEAKVNSPFAGRERDQLVRVIDVGSCYAATRYVPPDRYWTLAVLPEEWHGQADHNPHAVVARYKGNPGALREPLQHRLALGQAWGRLIEQELRIVASHVGEVSWEQLIGIAREMHDAALRDAFGPW